MSAVTCKHCSLNIFWDDYYYVWAHTSSYSVLCPVDPKMSNYGIGRHAEPEETVSTREDPMDSVDSRAWQ